MLKFLQLQENGVGYIVLPYKTKDNLSDRMVNMMNISIEDTTDEVFFIDLLKITIDAIKNKYTDDSADFETVEGELCKLKISNRKLTVDFYNTIESEFICSISVDLDLKLFVNHLLDDYRILLWTNKLKDFTHETKEYIDTVDKYYKELYYLNKTTL